MAKVGKRMRSALQSVDTAKVYGLDEALQVLKDNSKVKFDETVEVALMLGVDPRKANENIRGMLTLPHGKGGKKARVAVFARGAKAEEAKAAGADIIGAEDLVETIQGGTIDFDVCIATPDMMAIVGRLGKILGTKGLMPNPKLGTVTMNITQAVADAKAGQVEYRTEKTGIIHAPFGKVSFDLTKLRENFQALYDAVQRAKPADMKGTYLKKITLSSTMGVGLTVKV
jgi:large subunit ribosomal protein L1